MKKKLSFGTASRIVLTLMGIGFALCVVGLLFTAETDPVRTTLSILAIGCIIASFMVACTYCRCPTCGKVILVGMINATSCPRCHRSLTSGAKVKAKKKR